MYECETCGHVGYQDEAPVRNPTLDEALNDPSLLEGLGVEW
jgi:hypothetical protein